MGHRGSVQSVRAVWGRTRTAVGLTSHWCGAGHISYRLVSGISVAWSWCRTRRRIAGEARPRGPNSRRRVSRRCPRSAAGCALPRRSQLMAPPYPQIDRTGTLLLVEYRQLLQHAFRCCWHSHGISERLPPQAATLDHATVRHVKLVLTKL